MRLRARLLPLLAFLPACAAAPPPPAPLPPPPPPPPPVVVAPPPPAYSGLSREEFNRNAVRANLPVFWVADANHDGVVDPGEVAPLLFYPTEGAWVQDGKLTANFDRAFQALKAAGAIATASPPTADDQRRALVAQDLDQGLATLVASDFSAASRDDKALVTHMLKVGRLIDDLYVAQLGIAPLADQIAQGDDLSRSLFRRNWGPACHGPLTEKNPQCGAILGAHKPAAAVYPADIQQEPDFCVALEKAPGAKALLGPFTVVRKDDAGKLVAVPYTEAFRAPMMAVAHELQDASDDISDPSEAPLKAYLAAAAQSFATNDWTPSDEAWARMTVKNSRWYVRVAPDEVYWEPCSHKAGFHLTFARINQKSVEWQTKLAPFEEDMERVLAARIGPAYKARKVAFHLPDFIDIVINAGNDREPFGGTIGESLPNWGPVYDSGRGRTVAMVNVFTDADSVTIHRKLAESLLSKETLASYVDSPDPGLLDTILHEATHNLGPGNEYKVAGKTDSQVFGGPLASMLEELKAQTGALYFFDYVVKKGLLTPEAQRQAYTSSLMWALGHIAQGMYNDTHAGKPYSQLAAIQVGLLLDEQAMTFDPNAAAADGSVGAFTIHFDQMPAAVEKMMLVVGRLKAKNDRAAATSLVARYVDGPRVPQRLIADRELKYPKQSLVYSVRM